MKYTLAIIFLLSTVIIVNAQDAKSEINSQVWKPFIDAYNSFDTEKFMSVYSKDVVRIPMDQKRIFNFAEYKRNINRENQFNKNYKIKANLEVRFTDRIHSADLAYEKVILKIKMTDNNGQPATIYSAFQVLLKKEAGVWKIKFDTDSSTGTDLTEKDFAAASPM
jgi:ketosteroid isomerase-like protein